MAHFAQIDDNDTVVQVLVIEQDMINTGLWGDPSRWIQTSYNTSAGVHRRGGTPLRKNYAGIGYKYDRERDAFIPPKVFASHVLNEETCLWEAPVPYPTDGELYVWDEDRLNWVLIPQP